jgi:hypothetical protein
MRGDDEIAPPEFQPACIGPGENGILDSIPHPDDRLRNGIFEGLSLFPYLVGYDARDQPGVAAQRCSEPPSAFFSHFVVAYNGQIYDPSYGLGPFTSQEVDPVAVVSPDHENAAFAGFLFVAPAPLEGNWRMVRPNDLTVAEVRYRVRSSQQ